MPTGLNAPVLTVDVGLIHKVDTRNVENLFSMWTVFSRCSGSLEEGRRLENLSWRLWNRETFCCDPISEANATTPAISITSRDSEGRYSTEVPSLSASLDSLVDEEALEFESDHTSSSTSAPLDIAHPQIRRNDSVNSRSRGRERHITPDDLEKMVITIKEKKDLEPITLNISSVSPPLQPTQVVATAQPETKSLSPESATSVQSTTSDSTTSERSTTSVVRGFSPSHISSSYRSIPNLAAPSAIPTSDLVASVKTRGPQPKKQTMFALGGSSGEDSFSEQALSMERNLQAPPTQKKKAKFSIGGSSNEEDSSLPRIMQKQPNATPGVLRPAQKKTTSFLEELANRTTREENNDNPFDDSDEESESIIDDSAIDEDDSSDWEDSVEEGGNPSVDEKISFQRVDSRPQLVFQRSLITTMIHQEDRANALQNAAIASRSTPALQRSRTTSPNGPSLAASPDSDEGTHLMMKKRGGLKPIAEVPTGARPIIQTTTNVTPHQIVSSPRAVRKHVLHTEMPPSLRQHLLWERQQKSKTANAVLKRRHTAQDIANLKQYPEMVHMNNEDGDGLNASWNQYFSQGLGEYHSKGW